MRHQASCPREARPRSCAWPSPLAFLLLAGCLHPDPPAPAPTVSLAPPPSYPLTLRLVRETADGPPLPDAEAYLVPQEEASPDPGKLPVPRFADDRGLVSVVFSKPTTLLVQAFGPGKQGGGWTREGMTVQVGDAVATDRGLRVEGRTVTLPLLRAQLPFSVNASWGPAQASLAPNGSVVPARQAFDLPVPAPYAGRLASAKLDLSWAQGPTAFGDLYAGLSRGGAILAGPDKTQVPLPNAHETESVEGSPQGTGPLQAVALSNSAVQGTLALHLAGTLRFAGDWPRALPLPSCFAMEACVPLPPLPTA
ncbi:MAG TPA: hypothetical protein VM241_00650 [Candidatus Thermoplasmatota archaeon]|nr:hypothetical protein [Candidatus Thermoplasmatota archaeon]